MEKVHTLHSTGLCGVDEVLQGVRPGDNIVWQVDSVDDYIPFVYPFCQNASAEKRKLVYFRFADHIQLLPDGVTAEVFQLHPEDGFEDFINEIFDKIETFGIGACYVFDSLSELAVDWYSDRMLGNFFMLVCPYLYDFETVTYFGLCKHLHTAPAVNAIHTTAQVVIDVYRTNDRLYIHPLKVYKRYSDTMYMLHRRENGGIFSPVKKSGIMSEVFSSTQQQWLDFSVHRFDVWTRTFSKAQEEVDTYQDKTDAAPSTTPLYNKLLRMAVTREPRLMELAQRYFDLSDLVNIGKRMIGTGLIGGKSVGMLLARAILLKSDANWKERLSRLDSFYVGSDVYYTYLILNNSWWVRRKCHASATEFDSAQEAKQRLLTGTFPDDIRDQFREMLNYFGQSPIIVRSSSLLEDAFGNAFSGKYESVFCANQGTPEQRLEMLLDAVRIVYASALSTEALSYRAHWGLLEKDEQMALLIQRVSGAFYGKDFYPQIAGVGFSFNPYVWSSDIDPNAGMLRLVFGLGTRAVDRNETDHTRIVSLSAPGKHPEGTPEDLRRNVQRFVDLLDLENNQHTTREFDAVATAAGDEIPLAMFASQDEEIIRWSTEHRIKNVFPWLLTFDTLLATTSFPQDMRLMLATLETAYGQAVDIEFTGNFHDDGALKIGLVQCRPFQVRRGREPVAIEIADNGHTILATTGPVIGNSLSTLIDRLIYIVPSVYSSLSMSDRYAVARLVGKLVHSKDTIPNEVIMLVGPGRWGTSSPSLGVPVTFTEINTVTVLCEIAVMHEGLIPDISLGTHFFNDLVEMDMLYLALFPERTGNTFDKDFFETAQSRLTTILPEAASWAAAVRVFDSTDRKIYLKADPRIQSAWCSIQI